MLYLEHYNLKEKPFNISPGPRFLWFGEKHSEALATLKYGILENKGFLLLTGDVGVGKTALIHRLIQEIDSSTIVANIPDPGLNAFDFFKILASEFRMANNVESKGEFLVELKKFLYKTQSQQKRVLLIIDEAQRLNEEILEQVRLLSNIEMSDQKLINIFFVGQPEFSDNLMDPRNRAVRQRIAVSFHIDELTETETERYVYHRLKVAGATSAIFEPDALREIHKFSRGCPRLINIMCDHALLAGYSYGLKTIGAELIKECEWDLRIPAGINSKKADFQQTPMDTIRTSVEPQFQHQIQPESQPPVLNLAFETEPLVSKFWGKYAFIGLVCILGVVVSYLFINSGLLDETSAEKQPYSTQQLTEKPPAESSLAAVEKTQPDATALALPAPRTPVQETGTAPFSQDQESPGIGLPKDKFEIIDQTMTISPDQGPSSENDLIAASEAGSVASSRGDKGNKKAGADKTSVAAAQPSLETASAGANEGGRDDTGKSSSEQIKRVVERMAESQSRAALPQPEEGVVTGKQATGVKTPATQAEPADAVSSEIGPRVTDTVKDEPPVKFPPLQTAAVTPPPSPVQSKEPAKKVAEKPPDKAVGKIAILEGTAPAGEPSVKARLENRLRVFLQNYCATYAAKDLDKFSRLFGPGAQENGKPFQSLLPKYQQNFDLIEDIQYRIELQQYTYDSEKGSVSVEGNFSLKWLPPDKKWRENSGKIFMNLKDDGRSFVVQRLDYHGTRSMN